MHEQSPSKSDEPPPENNPPPFPLQKHKINKIQIMLFPPQVFSEHPQFVAAKSLISWPPKYCYNCIICKMTRPLAYYFVKYKFVGLGFYSRDDFE